MIGVVAGEGFLPVEAIKELLLKQEHCKIVCFEGLNYKILKENLSKDELDRVTFFVVKFKISNEIVNYLVRQKCDQVIFCGKVHYNGIMQILPSFRDLLDFFVHAKRTIRLIIMVSKIKKNANKGDDFLLNLLVSFFELNKIAVLSIDSILKNTLCKCEDLKQYNENFEKDLKDGKLGIEILNHVSSCDIGQSIVVQSGRVLGIEAAEGTDELIKRCGAYSLKNKDKRPVFCKSSKLNQNMKIDIAAIGVDTLENLNKLNYSSIILQVDKVLIIDRLNFFKKLKEYKINLIVL